MRCSAWLDPKTSHASRLPIDPHFGQAEKLLDQVRGVTRLKHYNLRTERTYCDWIERFIRFHEVHHPREPREEEIGWLGTWSARRNLCDWRHD
jgi:hypothetical protein